MEVSNHLHGDEKCCLCCEEMVITAHKALQSSALLQNMNSGYLGISLEATSAEDISTTEYEDEMAQTIQSLSNCMMIAEENPENPVTAIAEAAWNADERVMAGNSVAAFTPHVMERYGPVMSILTFANCNVVETEEGLVMIDCGTAVAAPRIFETIRRESSLPLHTAIYTHGHVDHVMLQYTGFEEEAIKKGYPRTRVIAHENVSARFDRYRLTAGYNTEINRRQFQLPKTFEWERVYRYPDEVYSSFRRLEIGTKVFELHHGKGETDDATIVYMPEERYVFTGDFFIWNTPNCGNPQKVQRFPLEWAQMLRKIASWKPQSLFPGHGPPIIGQDRVSQALNDTIALLEQICSSTLGYLNKGKDLNFIMNNVSFDKSLLLKPYLYPKYDDPRFIAATLWRRYAGWYTFEITRLLPTPKAAVGAELARLIGTPTTMSRRALELIKTNDPVQIGVALELVEFALAAIDATNLSDGDKNEIHLARAQVLRRKQRTETCLMARSIYKAAAIDSDKAVSKPRDVAKF
mmetsp:Transcript_1789/g.2052  ORF Transcript_1789/g.2052 Transcript_1789/m.2052 type:complete len:521 (-) Transcript_1789:138-1700(-)